MACYVGSPSPKAGLGQALQIQAYRNSGFLFKDQVLPAAAPACTAHVMSRLLNAPAYYFFEATFMLRSSVRSFAWMAFVLNTVLWGLYFSVARAVVQRVDPLVFGFLELTTTAPVALALLLHYGRCLTRLLWRQALVLGGLFALNTVLVSCALQRTTAMNAAFFPAAGGLLAAGLAVLLGQAVGRRTWAAGLLALAGAGLLVASGRAAGHGWGDALAFGGALAYMLYVFLADQLSHTAGPARWAVLGVELLATTAVLGVMAAGCGPVSEAGALRPADAGLIVGVGWGASLVPAAIALGFQRYVLPVTVEFIYALEPVTGALAGRWLLGEILPPLGWASGALILAGAVLHAWPAAPATPAGPPNSLHS